MAVGTFEWVSDFSSIVNAEKYSIYCFCYFSKSIHKGCSSAKAVVVAWVCFYGVYVVVDSMLGRVLMVMKMTIILVAAKMEVSMSMSDGGYLKAFTPMRTTRLKREMMSMMGA